MTRTIPEAILGRLSDLIVARMGLHFPVTRWSDLERRIRSVAPELGFESAEECAKWLISSLVTSRELKTLAGHLTVGETYFFRDREIFDNLRDDLVPQLIEKRRGQNRQLRIWSAGCSSGEEPYSIAILLDRLLPKQQDWKVEILATDLNVIALTKARVGIYTEWSFRSAPPWLKQQYFRRTADGRYQLVSSIRRMVRFAPLNLIDDLYPSAENGTMEQDIIFCRNVIMYFDDQRREMVARRLYQSLSDGGWLIVSPSEASHALFSQFQMVHRPGMIFFHKDDVHAGLQHSLPSWETRLPEPIEQTGNGDQDEPLHFEIPTLPDPLPAIGPTAPGELVTDRALTYQQALEFFHSGHYHEAAELLEAYLKEPGDHPSATLLLTQVYANQGRLELALRVSERALAAHKLDPNRHYLRATILQELDRLDEALQALRRAIYLDPNFVLAHLAMGNLLAARQATADAQKYYRNTLDLLAGRPADEWVAGSDGLTVGGLAEMIHAISG